LDLILALVVTAFGAAVQASVGFGFGVVSVPILFLIDPVLAPVPQLLLSLPLAGVMAWRGRGSMDLQGVGWILLGRLPGAAIGLVLLKAAGDRALDLVVGLMILGAVVVLALGVSIRPSRRTQFGAGIVSGATGLVASIGGPPLALLYRNERGATVRASLAGVFLIGLFITLGVRAGASELARSDALVALLLFPALVVGYAGGSSLAAHVEGRRLRNGILVVSAVAAAGLVMRSVLG
jgi:uncharacterized membrane protein YfcA